jgi:hypothetical protein
MNKRAGLILVLISVAVAIAFLVVAAHRELSSLENVLLQVLSLGLGLIGSYVLGVASARENAFEIVKPHARSAFRRVLSLYQSLSRLLQTMSNDKAKIEGNPEAVIIIEKFESIVIEQLATSGDSLEDWNDLVPEEIAALKSQLNAQGPRDLQS